jgi:hypothetical protein
VGQLDVKLIMDTAPFPRDEVPPQLRPYLRLDPTGKHYVPLLAANPVRPTRESFLPLNVTIAKPLPLRVSLAPVSIGTWQLLQVMDASLSAQQRMGATDKDTDEVVRLLSDTPLWLLGLTLVVSVVHLLFDVLAMKNDIEFWRKTQTLRGISVRSLAIQLVSQAIISLYLWSEGASLLVLLPQVGFTLLLVWKIAKSVGFALTTKAYIIPWVSVDSALAATATEGLSSEYDRQAVAFMSLLFAPIIAGFACYSFVHHQYAGWMDFALSTAVSAVYTFGFVMMCPQLWLNHKLRSVAHMPWSVLGYRFFNTVIDDLFAAIIRMPLMARISVFRDDVVFVLYLYQRWRYPVDKLRPAEGFDADESAAAASAAVAAASSAAPGRTGRDTAGSRSPASSTTEVGREGLVESGTSRSI